LDGLDLGTPDVALDELLGSPIASQQPVDSFDMPPLELDLPAVFSLNKTPSEVAPVPVTSADANRTDLIDDWAPLELPSTGDESPALGMQDAPGLGGTHDVSAEDLDMLGIESRDIDVNSLALNSADADLIEPEFAEDMQAAAMSEMAALSLDSSPLSLDASLHDLSALSLELEAVPEALASSSIEPIELPLDLPLSAPESSLHVTVSAPMSSSGMVSEHEVKLDIASAYIDMGDHAGAREMLQEVLASDGDELLKSRANQMLAGLSA